MDFHIDEFYQRLSGDAGPGKFHDVIALHNNDEIVWEDVSEKVPETPRGWYELAHLPSKDRIEFTFDCWTRTLSYNPKLEKCLEHFFNSLDDIGIYLVQRKPEGSYEAQMVYSLIDNNGFYRGGAPLGESQSNELKKLFPGRILPEDYLAFFRLHNGFWKTTDCTGITKSSNLLKQYQKFQELLSKEPALSTTKGDPVDPKSLIPFYESFGMPYYQCFWGEWYPEQEMGNVYYSSDVKAISDINSSSAETLAFPTFNDWLAFYLERIE